MINRNYKSFCERLKELQEDRDWCIENKDIEIQRKDEKEIKMLIEQMKKQKEVFSSISKKDTKMLKKRKYRKWILKEKNIYESISNVLDNISINGEIKYDDIKKLIYPRKKHSLKKFLIYGSIGAALFTGCGTLGHKIFSGLNKNKSTPTTETTIEMIYDQPDTQESSISQQGEDIAEENITEKDASVVNFGSKDQEEKINDVNESDNEINNDNDKKAKETKKQRNFKNETKKAKKKKLEVEAIGDLEPVIKDKFVIDEDTKPADENYSEDEKIPEGDNPEDYDLDNKEETNEEKIIEEPAPNIPNDMVVEESDDSNKDEEYFDEKDNSSFDNTNNEPTNIPSDSSNSSSNAVDEEPAPNIPNDMVVEESDDSNKDEEYFDVNDNLISKEEWEKLEEELINNPKVVVDEENELATQKEELQQVKMTLENIKDIMQSENDIEEQTQENTQAQVLQMSIN